ncbi:hypothetical protein [Fictibacillus barbaricus]|jgi:hypothetical protein|uniref:Uncharacterized protein n=1 Tax=Fictibacillus barbaricus TaxID=182136 RepID=A0ABU1TXW8_9BACL|nr:hypothetical protein [Fictibacillus barbaricus]MDR7072059.1 hypothetical protein [Fictibacillus barbaricus]
MGYILPYIPIQSMQYANRMEKGEQGIPVVSSVPIIQNDIQNSFSAHHKTSQEHKKISFQQVLSRIEGKGLIINETI